MSLVPKEKAVNLLASTKTQPLVTIPAEPLGVSSLVVYAAAVSTSTSLPLRGSSRCHIDWVVEKWEGQVISFLSVHLSVC